MAKREFSWPNFHWMRKENDPEESAKTKDEAHQSLEIERSGCDRSTSPTMVASVLFPRDAMGRVTAMGQVTAMGRVTAGRLLVVALWLCGTIVCDSSCPKYAEKPLETRVQDASIVFRAVVVQSYYESPPGFCLCNPTFSSGVRRLMPLKINGNPKGIPQYPLNEHTTANLDCWTGPGQELRTARGSLTALVTNDTFWNREKQPWVKDGSVRTAKA
ncbi:unnamed protein product [Plutella xylostella]|uniref:(diamondback moth) hypothetical protein n=1 Tax=Plutella xylostella TaxID=51655 RepID=A0A8S4FZZ5_PLUXY|nr:unnamed protein product [Plutella xylostella]